MGRLCVKRARVRGEPTLRSTTGEDMRVGSICVHRNMFINPAEEQRKGDVFRIFFFLFLSVLGCTSVI